MKHLIVTVADDGSLHCHIPAESYVYRVAGWAEFFQATGTAYIGEFIVSVRTTLQYTHNARYEFNPLQLESVAHACRRVVLDARADGLTIDRGNMLDLVADQLDCMPLETLKAALVVAGVGY